MNRYFLWTALCACFLHLVKGQSASIDVNPDVDLYAPPYDSTAWDMDGDGTADYALKVTCAMWGHTGVTRASIIPFRNNLVEADAIGALALQNSDSINSSKPWLPGEITLAEWHNYGTSVYSSHFAGYTSAYVGLKFYQGFLVNYGWMQVKIMANVGFSEIILQSYGYRTAPDETAPVDEVEIYPNPVVAESKIVIPSKHEGACQIYAADGRLINEINYSGHDEIKLTKSDFASGVYFYKITGFDKVITGKFIVD